MMLGETETKKKEEKPLCCEEFIHKTRLTGGGTNVLTTFMTKSVSSATGLVTSWEAR